MGIEIDFLPVGDNTKNGDAIVIRYGVEGNYKILVIDGGFGDSGEKIVEHINEYYSTDYVDYVLNTHPDTDHVTGLKVVLDKLKVGELWMHLPWDHSSKIRSLFEDGRITDNSLSNKIKDSLNAAYSLYELASSKNIPISEPFEGDKIGEFLVLSPLKDWYINYLLPDFPKMPKKKKFVLERNSVTESIMESAEWVTETWDIETLSEDYESTGARNESSVVLYGDFDGHKVLLTGDAGKIALHNSAEYADGLKINLAECNFVQMPHHGSRRNVSPSVLNRIIGEKIDKQSTPKKISFVSVSKQTEEHPKKNVVNAFIRRGAKVFETRGSTIRHYHKMPTREGWVKITPLDFNENVEK